jgi:hypothetical protein
MATDIEIMRAIGPLQRAMPRNPTSNWFATS